MGNRNVLEIKTDTVNHNFMSDPDIPYDVIDPSIEYMIKGLYDLGNKGVRLVDDDVDDLIYEDEYVILEVIKGRYFDRVEFPDYSISLPRGTLAVLFLQLDSSVALFGP